MFVASYPKRYSEPFENGDRYIICTFELSYGCFVHASSNSLEELLKEIPEHLSAEEENLSVCEVYKWRTDKTDSSDATPIELETLFQIQHYNDPSDDEEYEELKKQA